MATNSALFSSVAMLLALCAPPATAAEFSCPKYDHGMRLTASSIFDGDPALNYEQAPDDDDRHGSFWNVSRDTSDQPSGFHLVCSYSKAKLDLIIPATVKKCWASGTALSMNTVCR